MSKEQQQNRDANLVPYYLSQILHFDGGKGGGQAPVQFQLKTKKLNDIFITVQQGPGWNHFNFF